VVVVAVAVAVAVVGLLAFREGLRLDSLAEKSPRAHEH
jgi:hypothetical protein